MSLSDTRRAMRMAAITTAAEMIRSVGEEGSDHEDRDLTEEEHDIFLAECKNIAERLDRMAEKLDK